MKLNAFLHIYIFNLTFHQREQKWEAMQPQKMSVCIGPVWTAHETFSDRKTRFHNGLIWTVGQWKAYINIMKIPNNLLIFKSTYNDFYSQNNVFELSSLEGFHQQIMIIFVDYVDACWICYSFDLLAYS